jgi:hypothetical protein
LTEEQQGFMDALNAAEAMEVCADSSDATSGEETPTESVCTYEFTLNEASTPMGNQLTEQSTNCRIEGFDASLINENRQSNIRAIIDSTTVAEFTLDFNETNSVVHTFSYDNSNTGEESSDTTTPSETQTIECTGTVSGTIDNPSYSTDCPNGEFRNGTDNVRFWALTIDQPYFWELARGEVDLSALSADNPIVVPISYEFASADEGNGEGDGEDGPCSYTVTSTGISWSCTDGTLFTAVMEEWSNPDVFQEVECAAEGSFTVAEGQDFKFWFGFIDPFYDELSDEVDPDEKQFFDVPEDTEGVCAQSADEDTFTSVLPVPGVYGYTALGEDIDTELFFTLPGECSDTNYFSVNYYEYNIDSERYEYDDTYYAETMIEDETWCGIEWHDSYEGDVIVEFIGSSDVNAETNVELTAVDRSLIESQLPELADMPFSYTFDEEYTKYTFVLTEETRVSITVNSGQSCSPDEYEQDEEGNGLMDPQLKLYSGNASSNNDDDYEQLNGDGDEYDNNFYSLDNCSAQYVDETLAAGNYFIKARNDDFDAIEDRGTITVNSSVELDRFERDASVQFITLSVVAPSAVIIEVPAGGGRFIATLEPSDDSCDVGDPFLVVLDLNSGEHVASNDDGAEDYLGFNCWSSLIEIDLVEGKYLLISTTVEMGEDGYEIDDPESGAGTIFELKYGFVGSNNSEEQIVVEPSNDPVPSFEVPPATQLPVDQLKSGSNSTIAVADGVTTMVCSSKCVDDLFALEGVIGDVLTVSVGGESVVVKRGASKVRIPVSAGARDLVVLQKTATGRIEVVSSTKVSTAPANLVSTPSTSTSESGSNLLLMVFIGLGLLVLAGAGTTLIRRRKAN